MNFPQKEEKMKMKGSKTLIVTLAGLIPFVFSASVVYAKDKDNGPPDKVTHWTCMPEFSQTDAGWPDGLIPWVKAVKKATDGTVQIDCQPAGSLTSASEAFSATSSGMLDVTAGWATVYGGEMPEGMLAYGLAMGAKNPKEAWKVMWGPKYGVGKLVEKAANKHNLHWAGWTDQGPNAMFTVFPVHKLSDFKGKKMRAAGPQALFYQAIGGVPVSMDTGQIYTAIKLGTIEGTFWDTGGIDDMSFPEIIHYAVLPGWNPAQHQEIYVNMDSWNKLTQWQRDQIKGIFKPTYFKTSKMHLQGVKEALQAVKDHGGHVVHLSDDQVKKMRNISVEKVWPKVAAKSKLNAKGVKIYKRFLEDMGEYKPSKDEN
jgi:TRAP-type C4-dicarboxylate transport system substrate-binding protein